jgi:hypothetical protein
VVREGSEDAGDRHPATVVVVAGAAAVVAADGVTTAANQMVCRSHGNGYPPPVYPRVKTLLGCGFGRILPPTGLLTGENFTHRVKRVRVCY